MLIEKYLYTPDHGWQSPLHDSDRSVSPSNSMPVLDFILQQWHSFTTNSKLMFSPNRPLQGYCDLPPTLLKKQIADLESFRTSSASLFLYMIWYSPNEGSTIGFFRSLFAEVGWVLEEIQPFEILTELPKSLPFPFLHPDISTPPTHDDWHRLLFSNHWEHNLSISFRSPLLVPSFFQSFMFDKPPKITDLAFDSPSLANTQDDTAPWLSENPLNPILTGFLGSFFKEMTSFADFQDTWIAFLNILVLYFQNWEGFTVISPWNSDLCTSRFRYYQQIQFGQLLLDLLSAPLPTEYHNIFQYSLQKTQFHSYPISHQGKIKDFLVISVRVDIIPSDDLRGSDLSEFPASLRKFFQILPSFLFDLMCFRIPLQRLGVCGLGYLHLSFHPIKSLLAVHE